MNRRGLKGVLTIAVSVALLLTAACGRDDGSSGNAKADPGITDTSITFGAFSPLSGTATVASSATKGSAAYFKYLNDEKGGVKFGDGKTRKIDYKIYDSQNTPSVALQQTRKLVEDDQVFALYGSNGTSTNLAVRDYLNQKKVPQLFLVGGASAFGLDYKQYPWTMPWQLDYVSQGAAMGKYVADQNPKAQIAVLYQNDDYGKDYLKGFKQGLGDKASQIVKEASYEATDATVNSQMSTLKDTGADTLVDFTIDKFTTQVITQLSALNWHPLHLLGSSGTAVVPKSGAEAAGIISTAYLKVTTDPAEANTDAVKQYKDIIAKYGESGLNPDDQGVVYGVAEAMTLQHVLEQMTTPTRAGLMKAAKSIKDYVDPLLLDGIKINTSDTDYFPIQQTQMREFDGTTWNMKGGIIDGAA